MTNGKLRLVSFGAAKALTRDLEVGDYTEFEILPSRTQIG